MKKKKRDPKLEESFKAIRELSALVKKLPPEERIEPKYPEEE